MPRVNTVERSLFSCGGLSRMRGWAKIGLMISSRFLSSRTPLGVFFFVYSTDIYCSCSSSSWSTLSLSLYLSYSSSFYICSDTSSVACCDVFLESAVVVKCFGWVAYYTRTKPFPYKEVCVFSTSERRQHAHTHTLKSVESISLKNTTSPQKCRIKPYLH